MSHVLEAPMTNLSGEFEVTSWNEDTYAEPEGNRKLTHAAVGQSFTGDLAGTGSVDWLMCYQPDGTAHFVGLQRIEGTIDGREGSVVLESIGDFDGKEATGAWAVVPGSGTGDLAGMKGEGRFRAPMGPTASFTLDCSFE